MHKKLVRHKPQKSWVYPKIPGTVGCELSGKGVSMYPALKGAVIHSDRRSQYTSGLYRSRLAAYQILQSMNSAGGRCHDNARSESMWARMKTELPGGRYDSEKMMIDELSSVQRL